MDQQFDDETIPIETTVRLLHQNLVDIAKDNLKCINTFRTGNWKIHTRKSWKWFDDEYKIQKRNLNNSRKSYQQALKFNFTQERISSLRSV